MKKRNYIFWNNLLKKKTVLLLTTAMLASYSATLQAQTGSTKTISVQITSPNDDLEEYLPAGQGQSTGKVIGNVDESSSDLELGSVTTGTIEPQLVGLRFPNINIPKGAVITSAYLQFEVDANDKNASPCNFGIYAENSDNALAFSFDQFVLSSRSKLTDTVTWEVQAGDGEVIDSKLNSSDISTLVQLLVNRNNWLQGNAMAFYIKGTGTREVESQNGEAAAAPKLVITYTMPMVLVTNKIKVNMASDDVEEFLAPKVGQTQTKIIGVIDSTSSDIELGFENKNSTDPQMVGLRFNNIPFAKSSTISKAYIEFEVDDVAKNTNPCNLWIYTEDADSSATFNFKPFSLTNRIKVADSIAWNLATADLSIVNNKGNSANITQFVQNHLNRQAWKSGNAMSFFIKGIGTREVESIEGESAAAASLVIEYYREFNSIDSVLAIANTKIETDYTTPSWFVFKKAISIAKNKQDSASISNVITAINSLKYNTYPYNVVTSFNGSPKTQLGFAWFTNVGVSGGEVQLVEGNSTNFATPTFTFSATSDSVKNLNYNVSANGLTNYGYITNSKKSYMSNKALATGLKPNTTYSYRVGKAGAWSEVGSFTTAKDNKDEFSFVYFTDPQANTEEMFDISAKTTHAASTMYPNANFWLSCGDLIETSGSTNSEWEYERFFETQQDIWLKKPFAPVIGNHDNSANKNFTNHFNTANPTFDKNIATTPGSVYSFVYGDALFMALNYENYATAGYLDSLALWMNKEVKSHPEVKWRVAFYHKTMFTGSQSHQSDGDGKTVREKMGPVFDSLKIDFAMQGHDHVYEVIGPVKAKQLISGTISDQQIVPATIRDNVTGLLGGTFNVTDGTLYFLNNSGGKKKYEPRSQAQMLATETSLGMSNYFGLFTGRFGQTGEPTFSHVSVSSDSISISTYTVNDIGEPTLFDKFYITKSTPVASVSLSDSNVTVFAGQSKSLAASVLPIKATNKTILWKSLNANIASVDSNGIVIGLKPGLTQIVAVSQQGLKTDTCVFVVKAAPYGFIATQSNCKASTFCLPIEAKDSVSDVLGYDLELNFDANQVIPTGNITLSGNLINPSFIASQNKVDVTTGKMYISIFLNANAPLQTTFKGKGQIACIEFTKKAAFEVFDTARFSFSLVQESYIQGVVSRFAEPGIHTNYQDSLFTGSLVFWSNNSPIIYDTTKSETHLITSIFGVDTGCNVATTAILPNTLGKFIYSIWNGTSVKIERDILETTDVQTVINSSDALMVRKLLVNDPSFKPTIFQMLAMDVNADGVISAGDVSQISQRSVLIAPEFKQSWNYNNQGVSNGQKSKDWFFVNTALVNSAEYAISKTFPNNDGVGYSKNKVPVVPNCLALPVKNITVCPEITSDIFKGILRGDVSASYASIASSGALKAGVEQQTAMVLDLSKASVVSNNGFKTIVDVPLFVTVDTVLAYDYAVKFNEKKISLSDEIQGLGESNVSTPYFTSYFNTTDNTLRSGDNSFTAFDKSKPVSHIRFSVTSETIEASDIQVIRGIINDNLVAISAVGALKLNTETFESIEIADINVYPNPAKELLNIQASDISVIEILDIQGNVLLHTSASKLVVDVKTYAAGLYTVKISNNKTATTRQVAIER